MVGYFLPDSVIVGGNMYFSCRQGCEMSVKELDGLLGLLTEKRRKMEQQEAEMNMQILLDFLQCLKKKKLEELNEVGLTNIFIWQTNSSIS